MAWDASAQSNDSSLFSRGSSWAEGEEDEGDNALASSSSSSSSNSSHSSHHQLSPVATRQSRHYSFAEHAFDDGDDENDGGGGQGFEASSGGSSVPAEKERQLLLLMLLAQVCSLHDPTPKTFTVHVLELFERGILDRQSILFLFELGLVPSMSTKKLLLPSATNTQQQGPDTTAAASSSEEYSLVDAAADGSPSDLRFCHKRTAEASAIRLSLEQQERQQRYRKSQSEPIPSQPPRPASWAAKHHPLSLSRYQREFQQQRLLSSGAFGQVFQATSNMDGRDYAIKRIPFSATGYSRDSVQQVVREVHCLANLDHPHVVRYYTSWLEPSWMTGTGSGPSSVVDKDQQQKLLRDITQMVGSPKSHGGDHDDGDEESQLDATNRLKSYFDRGSSAKRPQRRFSFDASDHSWEMSVEAQRKTTSFSKDDLFTEDIFESSSRQGGVGGNDDPRRPPDARQSNKQQERRFTPKQQQQKQQDHYRYQICLFIQMQLCHPSTLADWIRERNNSQMYNTVASRVGPVREIFRQICLGLKHVHDRSIVHRDLKPANIFATVEGELQFKIGDFGLSKMIRSVASPKARGTVGPLLLSSSEEFEPKDPEPCYAEQKTPDPMTAGVGTASYASPEQVSSKTYGKEADIYSLGLILLELLCCFGTEHERYQTFHDCRHRRSVPSELPPQMAAVILACTEPVPSNRPSADQLVNMDLAQKPVSAVAGDGNGVESKQDSESVPPSHKDDSDDDEARVGDLSEVEALRRLVDEKDTRVRRLEAELAARDRQIAVLQSENDRLRKGVSSRTSSNLYTYPSPQSSREFDHEHTSSSEEEL